MYAIVEIAGQQFKVKKDQKVFVHRLDAQEGDKVNFDNVLLLDNDGQVTIGAPAIEGAAVAAKILRHLKGDKVIVFKKKRRKGYKKKNGHRQYLTEIVVEDVIASGFKSDKKKEAKAKPAAKKAPAKKAPAKKAEKEAVAEPAKFAEVKEEKAPAKKAPAKKEAVKKAPAKKAPAKKATAKADDLKKIEGIGPKIAGILTEAGYETFAKLSKADPEKIREILLEKGGKRYAMHNPTTWAKQAELAAEGKWEELKKWQDELDGGRA
jgi:large subunit ribosomal protein L21